MCRNFTLEVQNVNDLKEICECNLDHTSSMIYFLTVFVQKMHVQVMFILIHLVVKLRAHLG